LHPADPWVQEVGVDFVRNIYAEKFQILSTLQPCCVLEIGCRCGYFAATVLSACPQATYTAIDADLDADGGWAGAPALAQDMLARYFPGRATITIANTQELTELEGNFDLVHVDGDHSYQGALHDLHLAEKVTNWVLVDDVDHIEGVGRAMKDFLHSTGYYYIHMPTIRGDMLIHTKDNMLEVTRGYTLIEDDRLMRIAYCCEATSHLPGVMAECGVYKGGSAALIASGCPHKELHLFDSLGLPFDDIEGGHHKQGEFANSETELRKYLAPYTNVFFHIGIFPETAIDECFSLVHLDMDLYVSTKAALEWFLPRMVSGGIIVLDDLGWHHCPGVDQALKEVGRWEEVQKFNKQGVLVC